MGNQHSHFVSPVILGDSTDLSVGALQEVGQEFQECTERINTAAHSSSFFLGARYHLQMCPRYQWTSHRSIFFAHDKTTPSCSRLQGFSRVFFRYAAIRSVLTQRTSLDGFLFECIPARLGLPVLSSSSIASAFWGTQVVEVAF